mmetsp:Transcript_30858/g.68133  ORF Transcript_30858/g.68133 Transcript_30858/m.68133 type:complete len:108 (-) Transcript_30858:273-596(-)
MTKSLMAAEKIVLCGLVNKPNPMGAPLIRQLILTSHKRLLYVDAKSQELKGEIDFHTQGGLEHFVNKVNPTTFEVHSITEKDKVFRFITRDELTAKHWTDAIAATKL